MTGLARELPTGIPVDIVIPVFNAPEDLARCVDSVLACTRGDYRLILIDDASTDPAIGLFFDQLARRNLPQLVALRNESNRGFTGTANRGMQHGAAEGRDVVLLNSDTVVTDGWLDALLRCAASSPHIGTITPFSNNAEICSFPRFCEDNRWPEGADPEVVRAALARAAVPTYPELPTGVGFCLFIRRDLLRGIGIFDEEAFGRGYGEENDFCLRGFRAGWRNVLCDDAFVLHLGARSFSADKAALVATNTRVLRERFPHYEAMVSDYIARDPLLPIRNAALATMRAHDDPLPGVLHIIHGQGGGTEHHVRALIGASRERCRHYLAIARGAEWRIEEHPENGDLRSFAVTLAPGESLHDFLAGLAATFRIGLIHLHNISGCREGLAEALRALRIPYGYTVHDLNFACPTITLAGRDGLFCGGETDAAVCRACLAAQPAFSGIDIVRWREAHRELVGGAGFVIAPSRWAADTFVRYFPGKAVDVIAHGAPGVWAGRTLPDTADRRQRGPCSAVLLPEDDVPTVAVLGAIGPDKGARRIERMVALARASGMRLRFVVIGYLDIRQNPWQSDDARLTVHGRYEADDLPRLLRHYRARLVAFPSAGPETFSFTLSEAWAAGLPVVVPPFGALAERVGAAKAGWILDAADWRDDARMLERIAAIVSDREALAQAGQRASAAFQPTLVDMAARTLAHYATLAPRIPDESVRWAPQRLRDAGGYRLWWPPESIDNTGESASASTLDDPLPARDVAGVRRYLRRMLPPGRTMARLLPASLLARLRARLR